ncbi:LysR family transcriptional regulator [Maribacter polysiphoniae]|uniref:DNA-binding transcriptional LysR family regulator n=1 Tax=Maribacter polysiphoniae TaxID=429344 RepID=A0A316DVS5_9FLAO|nr:LysR family transcriptional regulator [Maribacter polysiphoniae]MBD1263051.1 LysR family transcriptional regulator [Maribacter polysiphoniae]PWK22015.1 DNA-binding transcriptional LysR family regulator [Maribacter polysiphoniae]
MKTKLRIFKIVATHLSFTKAAEQLFISQPAVSKAIRNLEDEYRTTLFLRKRNSIALTSEGKAFLVYTNKILEIHDEMEQRFLHQKEQFPDIINFGVSTTLANYIIPKVIAKFRVQFPKTNFNITSGNSDDIATLILNQELNFGITEGKNTNRKLHFTQFIKDEIVLVTHATNNAFKKGSMNMETLQEIPMVMREMGSGTREIVFEYLSRNNIKKLNTVVTLNSTEAIKNYLFHSDNYAFISINAITDELMNNKLKIIDVKDLTIERWFYFVSRTGFQSDLIRFFENYILNTYNF